MTEAYGQKNNLEKVKTIFPPKRNFEIFPSKMPFLEFEAADLPQNLIVRNINLTVPYKLSECFCGFLFERALARCPLHRVPMRSQKRQIVRERQ